MPKYKYNRWHLGGKNLVYVGDPHPISRKISVDKAVGKLIIEIEIPFEDLPNLLPEDIVRKVSGGGSIDKVTSIPWGLIDKFLIENEV